METVIKQSRWVLSALMRIVETEIYIEKYSVTAHLLKVWTGRYMLG